jgi:uncharacterized membrane protein YphA (DoxX/SURF4 family)
MILEPSAITGYAATIFFLVLMAGLTVLFTKMILIQAKSKPFAIGFAVFTSLGLFYIFYKAFEDLQMRWG